MLAGAVRALGAIAPRLGFPRGPSLPQGVTRLLLTRIPFFKEIIVSSFSCDSCSWSNTEIQSAGRIQEQGVRYILAVASRQVGRASPLCSRPKMCTFLREGGLQPTPPWDPSVWKPLDLLRILRLLPVCVCRT